MTSHYNIYFNGMDSYNRGISKAENSNRDDYTQILPLFYYTDKNISQAVSPDMDRAAKKATKVITLHSITAKPEMKKGPQTQKEKDFYNLKEYNKWMDENYLLLGKSYVYKNEYSLAVETFKHIISEFPNTGSKYAALIWLARCYNEIKEYREAERILNLLESDEKMPGNLFGDFYVTFSDYYIKQSNFEKAALMLDKALEFPFKKHYRVRYTYILAQIWQRNNDFNKAAENYRRVIKMDPPYEMTFNAKINLAGTFDARTGEGREIRSLLLKMLKDDKNKEFQDQIYYALGKMALKENNADEAIDFFKKSAAKSTKNNNQKGLTFLSLADMYYDRQDYKTAQAYYDSTLQNIGKGFENFEILSRKAKSLTNLVNNLNIYQLEDSLQVLAKMSDEERNGAIDRIIAAVVLKEQEDAKKKQNENLDTQYALMNQQINNPYNTGEASGKWYFYNPNAKSFGQPEFRMKWGNRKLEDNWRRKNKQVVEVFETAEVNNAASEKDSSGTGKNILSNKNREYYLKDIPLTPEAMSGSHERLVNALYNSGIIYNEDLKDTDKAIETFEELIKRYPDNENALLSYFNLYKIYDNKGDSIKSREYINLITSRFPESPTAMILANPDYVIQLREKENEMNNFYENTFKKYISGDYAGTTGDAELAIKNFPGSRLLPKFELLKALSAGQLQGREKMKEELETLVKKYPGDDVSSYGRELIDYIYSQAPEIRIADTQKAAAEIYRYDSTGTHHAMISATKKTNIKQLNFNLVNFNLDHYNNLNLGISLEEVGDTSLLTISSFSDPLKAKTYMEAVSSDTLVFKGTDTSDILLFIISDENLKILKEDKDIGKYYFYYDMYYKKNPGGINNNKE